jgi:hypothetical protein
MEVSGRHHALAAVPQLTELPLHISWKAWWVPEPVCRRGVENNFPAPDSNRASNGLP